MFLVFGLFFSCGQKYFSKADYTFFDKDFVLDPGSELRTDGVYVLSNIWTDENGGTETKPALHKFYKFYRTGQCNLILDPDEKIKTEHDYKDAVKKALENSRDMRPTLFEAYYRLKQNKIIIQGIVHPVKQFEYKYGYVYKDRVVIVKATHEGNGKFEDKYFTDYYKEYYSFLPFNSTDNDNGPNW